MIYDVAVERSARPPDWTVEALRGITEVLGGGTPDTFNLEYWSPPDIPWVTPTDITACANSVLTQPSEQFPKRACALAPQLFCPRVRLFLRAEQR